MPLGFGSLNDLFLETWLCVAHLPKFRMNFLEHSGVEPASLPRDESKSLWRSFPGSWVTHPITPSPCSNMVLWTRLRGWMEGDTPSRHS